MLMAVTALLSACRQVPEAEMIIHTCSSPSAGRACGIYFAADSTAYIATGRLQDGGYTSSMLRYNASTDTWTETSTPLQPRANGTACVTSQGVFIGLGYNHGSIYESDSYLRDWWLFDPSTETWTRLADCPSDKTDAAVCWSDGQSIRVACGFNGFTNDVFRYDISTDSWAKTDTDSPIRVFSAVAASCQGRHFLGTGYRRHSHDEWWECFADGHYEKRSSVPGQGRHNAACAATRNAVWVIAGLHYGDTLTTGFFFDDIVRYTPADDQWTLCGTLPCGTLENGAACAIGNRIYFGLGEDKNGQLHTSWYYVEE